MSAPQQFKLDFLRTEQHLMLPTITSIKLTQNLYDALFQYIISEETEELLKRFIGLLEDHIKRKDRTPFSLPIADLEFLDEGLQELRLLNWMEIPVSVFEISLDENIEADKYEDEMEIVLSTLEGLMIFSRPSNKSTLWVYPYVLVR